MLKQHITFYSVFAPFGCTHPPPPVLPYLLTQNLSPKDIVTVVQDGYETGIRVELLIHMRTDRALAMAWKAASPGNSPCSIR